MAEREVKGAGKKTKIPKSWKGKELWRCIIIVHYLQGHNTWKNQIFYSSYSFFFSQYNHIGGVVDIVAYMYYCHLMVMSSIPGSRSKAPIEQKQPIWH